MSALDVHAKSVIFLYIGPLVLIYLLLLTFLPNYLDLYVHRVYIQYFNSLQTHREKLLQQIKAQEDSIKILELRLNKGENLDFYPEQSDIFVLTATEEQAVQALKSKCCNYAKVEPQLLNLKHFDDEEIDVVVGTSALCRCQDQTKLLAEIRRVLVPNGKYLFIEHTNHRASNPLAYVVREVASRVAPHWLPDMCDLNSEPAGPLRRAGFRRLRVDELQIRSPVRALRLIQNHIIGVAVK